MHDSLSCLDPFQDWLLIRRPKTEIMRVISAGSCTKESNAILHVLPVSLVRLMEDIFCGAMVPSRPDLQSSKRSVS